MFLKGLFVFKMNDSVVYVLQNILPKLTCLFSDSLFFILSSLFPTNINLSNFGVQYVHTCGPQTALKPLLCPLSSIQFSPPNHEDLHCPRSLHHRPGLRSLSRGWRGCCHVHCRHPHWWGTVFFSDFDILIYWLLIFVMLINWNFKNVHQNIWILDPFLILHQNILHSRFQAWGGSSSVWEWPCCR